MNLYSQRNNKCIYFYLITLIQILFNLSHVSSQLKEFKLEPQFVIDVESSNNFKELNPAWGSSEYLRNYKNGVDFKFDSKEGTQFYEKLDPVRIGVNSTIILHDESFGVIVPFVNIIKDNQKILISGEEFTMTKNISNNIIPKNYFDNSKYVSSDDPIRPASIAECFYTNPGPRYVKGIFKSVNITNIVSLFNYNLGLILGEKGLKVMKISSNLTLGFSDLDTFLNSTLENENNYDKTSNLEFKQIFLLSNLFKSDFDDYLLTGVTVDNDVYFYNITENRFAGTFTLKKYSKLDKSYFENIQGDFLKMGLSNDIIVIAIKGNGVMIFKNIDGNDTTKWTLMNYESFNYVNEQYKLEINDMILNNNTIYIICKDLGMIIFDLKAMKFVDFLFKHPNFTKFDFTNYNGVHYIGIAVDNNPPSVPEFFIEIINNCDNEYEPLINKVFTSNRKFSIENIISDNELGVTYALDRITHKLLVLTRAVPNILTSYNFELDVSDFNFDVDSDLPVFLLAERGKYPSSLIIQHGEDLAFFGHFEYPVSTFTCNYKEPGDYLIKFSAPEDCSQYDYENYKYVYSSCWYNTTYSLSIAKEISGSSNAGWVILALILFLFVCVILVFLYKIFMKRRGRSTKIEYHNPPKEMEIKGEIHEMVEVNIDN